MAQRGTVVYYFCWYLYFSLSVHNEVKISALEKFLYTFSWYFDSGDVG